MSSQNNSMHFENLESLVLVFTELSSVVNDKDEISWLMKTVFISRSMQDQIVQYNLPLYSNDL